MNAQPACDSAAPTLDGERVRVALPVRQLLIALVALVGGLFGAGWIVSEAVNSAKDALEAASREGLEATRKEAREGLEAVRKEISPLVTDVALMRQALDRTVRDIGEIKDDGKGFLPRDVFDTWRNTIDSRLSGVEGRVGALEKDRK